MADRPTESGTVASDDDGGPQRPKGDWLGWLASSLLGAAGSIAVSDLNGTLGYRGLPGVVTFTGVVATAAWMRRLHPKAPLLNSALWFFLTPAALAAIAAAASPKPAADICATVAVAFAVGAVFRATDPESVARLLGCAALVGVGVAAIRIAGGALGSGHVLFGATVIGGGVAAIAGGAARLVGESVGVTGAGRVQTGAAAVLAAAGMELIGVSVIALNSGHELFGAAVIAGGVAAIAGGAARVVDRKVAGSAAVVGAGAAVIGVGVAALASAHVLFGTAVIGGGLAAIGVGVAALVREPVLSGSAAIAGGMAAIGGGAAALHDRHMLFGPAIIAVGTTAIGGGLAALGLSDVGSAVRKLIERATTPPPEEQENQERPRQGADAP